MTRRGARPAAAEQDGDRVNEISVILGIKKSGKSTQARRLIADSERRIVIDPMLEHQQLGVIARSFQELVEYIRPRRLLRYSVVLRTTSRADVMAAIALATAGEADDPPLPGVTVLVDEADRLCSPSSLPEPLNRLVNYGRHYKASLIAIARRPKRLHHDITGNADRIILGKTQEPADVDYLEEFIGERLAQRAKRLQLREFVTWPDDLEGEERETAAGESDTSLAGGRRRGSRKSA